RRQTPDDLGEVSLAADFFELAAAGELVRDGDLVDCLVPLPESEAGLVDPAVLLTEEVAALEDGRDLVDGLGVDEERGDYGLFGLDVVGWEAFECERHAKGG